MGGISGNPKRFIEDFKILRSNQVNLFSALFITIKKYFGYALGFIIPKRLKQFRFRLLSKMMNNSQFDIPILLITYNRLETAKKVFSSTKTLNPIKLYFVL